MKKSCGKIYDTAFVLKLGSIFSCGPGQSCGHSYSNTITIWFTGMIMKSNGNPDSVDVMHAPFMLFPTPIPRASYEQAKAVQTDFNLLMHKVAHDYDFMKESLKGFVSNMFYTYVFVFIVF